MIVPKKPRKPTGLPILNGTVHIAGDAETVTVSGVQIPVIGYANCTGHPLPGDAENTKRIRAHLSTLSDEGRNLRATPEAES